MLAMNMRKTLGVVFGGAAVILAATAVAANSQEIGHLKEKIVDSVGERMRCLDVRPAMDSSGRVAFRPPAGCS